MRTLNDIWQLCRHTVLVTVGAFYWVFSTLLALSDGLSPGNLAAFTETVYYLKQVYWSLDSLSRNKSNSRTESFKRTLTFYCFFHFFIFEEILIWIPNIAVTPKVIFHCPLLWPTPTSDAADVSARCIGFAIRYCLVSGFSIRQH